MSNTPDYTTMNGPQMLAALGDDAEQVARAAAAVLGRG